MGKKTNLDFGLAKLDDLFSTEEERQEAKLKKIEEVPLELIDPFPEHPYKVRDDEDMQKHVAQAVRFQAAVNNAVIHRTVAEEQSHDNQKRHQRKVEVVQAEIALKIARNRDNHFTEGEHLIKHGALGEVLKVNHRRAGISARKRGGNHAEQNRRAGGEACMP